MKTSEIVAMKPMIDELVEDDCHLYLWVTNNFLPDGLKVMEAWGFRYVTMITWLKDKAGLGQYYRGITESCLFGVKGKLPYKIGEDGKRRQGVTGFKAVRREHSQKPEKMRDMIMTVSYGPYLELFAREPHPGWDVWGNEVESSVDLKGGSNGDGKAGGTGRKALRPHEGRAAGRSPAEIGIRTPQH